MNRPLLDSEVASAMRQAAVGELSELALVATEGQDGLQRVFDAVFFDADFVDGGRPLGSGAALKPAAGAREAQTKAGGTQQEEGRRGGNNFQAARDAARQEAEGILVDLLSGIGKTEKKVKGYYYCVCHR